jgi:hypothetical protein
MLSAMVGVGSAAGSLALSLTLGGRNDYTPFLLIAAAATLTGAALYGMTGGKLGESATSGEVVGSPPKA